ncbi:MAG: sodium:proton antiporter [Planctomycetota bacterium]|nr:sodium:proton antiporter [Planctomycetota bacterium]
MEGNDEGSLASKLHGPHIWAISAAAGLVLGAVFARVFPGILDAAGKPVIPLWAVIPFATLLAAIALMPFISERLWHRHFPDFAFGLGGLVLGWVVRAFPQPMVGGHGTVGGHAVMHAFIEYYSFVALVCGLYVVSGGVLINLKGRGTPLMNVALLAFGAVFANLVGTTGASMLLLRPFMRMNEGRLKPIHIVFFIMIVSNCGGLLTPIGDPPLYLGYLKGVPFSWTLFHLWNEWLLVVGILLMAFFVMDARTRATAPLREDEPRGVEISGTPGLVCLALMIAGVFIDPILKSRFGIEGYPVGATFQLLVAGISYSMANRRILEANQFSFFPVKEVSLLFLGIFLTMIPALGYLSVNGQKFGVDTPTAFYFVTGALSAVLDNAPTYVNFLQIAVGPVDINAASIGTLLEQDGVGRHTLAAISSGAVFFGAITYIGNGPNFMVRTIASSAGVKMPGFFGYMGWTLAILLPILIINWAIFIR